MRCASAVSRWVCRLLSPLSCFIKTSQPAQLSSIFLGIFSWPVEERQNCPPPFAALAAAASPLTPRAPCIHRASSTSACTSAAERSCWSRCFTATTSAAWAVWAGSGAGAGPATAWSPSARPTPPRPVPTHATVPPARTQTSRRRSTPSSRRRRQGPTRRLLFTSQAMAAYRVVPRRRCQLISKRERLECAALTSGVARNRRLAH